MVYLQLKKRVIFFHAIQHRRIHYFRSYKKANGGVILMKLTPIALLKIPS